MRAEGGVEGGGGKGEKGKGRAPILVLAPSLPGHVGLLCSLSPGLGFSKYEKTQVLGPT